VVLARQRGLGPEDEAPGERAAREQLRREVRLLAPARRLALRGDLDSFELRLVLGPPDDELLRRVAALVARPIAVSRPFGSAGERQGAEAEARGALEAALALPDPPSIARADRLAAYRLLGAMHNLADGPRLARALLEPILDARPDVRRERLQTLRAILERGGVNEAAAVLGVHRNTIAYRLRAIERRTGWRLSDPELRLPLSIAVELVHEDQV
jgi:DNA-binding PucR family transcriptional regulator